MMQYRNPVNRRVHRDYTWCSLCEQCHATSRWERRGWFCPAGCGGTALDALPWEFVRQVHPEYPEAPQAGRNYVWHVHHAPTQTSAQGSGRMEAGALSRTPGRPV